MIQKILGQLRLATTGTLEKLYEPAAGVEASNLSLWICNDTTSALWYEVYLDKDGGVLTISDDDTLIYAGKASGSNVLTSGQSTRLLLPPMSNGETLYVNAQDNDSMVFTLSGLERLIA